MRFDKGSMVEVFSKKKDPSGVWRCAQIVEDNGDGYTVRYYRSPHVAKEGVDKVPSGIVRPRPPSLTGSTVWAVGDVLEVLDDGYWRVSMIEEVIEDDEYYGIQVIGSVDQFRVRKSGVRARQEWKDNQWVPMEKDSGIDKKLISRMQKMAHMQTQGDLNILKDQKFVLLSKTRKRSLEDYLSNDEAYLECGQQQNAVNKEVEHHVEDSYSFTGKVQTPGKLRKILGKEKVQISKETTKFNNTSYKKYDNPQPLGRTFEHDCVDDKSSVGSNSNCDAHFDRLVSHLSSSCSQDSDSAESVNHKGDDEGMSPGHSKRVDTLRSHELELSSYRSTLEALYACGPLSWELETYLTNLRQKYSVSTDEHLVELRRLKSSRGIGLSCY
ncbi:hypothetical protein SOVF_098780 [Spinacia oleracea]|uniref:Uncharacterized protein LOC110777823 n=1 Tax=Spinacia oleracea TaxID=3562 RepID=A0A9R0HW39_SPIOL|nr:uncharacterized protein LOC110777823 [Spinacia oleracea]XP_021838102.1 uncharacterized protein LOC110777823 [Spinacia oleracea]KNA15377.1 hypothetical protein SOVF_098780 [Spinacia oleracea]